jgi:hypothetical protein
MPTYLIQTNLARIAVIVGGILQDIYAPNSASIHMYERYINELEIWLSALPPTLRFYADHSGDDVRSEESRGDRIAKVGRPPLITANANGLKHNLELVYLGAMLLLTRPLLLDFTAMVREQNPSVTQLSTRLYAQTWYVSVATHHFPNGPPSSWYGLFLTCHSVDTANQISHLSSQMKGQGLLAMKSWPIMSGTRASGGYAKHC